MNFNVSFKAHKSYYGKQRGIELKKPLNYERIAKRMQDDPKFKQGVKDYIDEYAHRPRHFSAETLGDTFVKPQNLEELVAKSDIVVEDIDVQDVYESLKNESKEEPFQEYTMQGGRNFSKPLALLLAGATVVYAGSGLAYVSQNTEVEEPEIVIVENVDSPVSLLIAAGEHDIKDIGMLLSYNGIDDISHIKEPMSIKIPNKYDVVTPQLNALEDEFAQGGKNDYQTAKLQVQIADLKAKKERQDELAFAFQEGKYVHFYMKDYTLASELENAFNIKHGKLEKVGSDNNIYEYYDDPALSQHQIYRAKLKDIRK